FAWSWATTAERDQAKHSELAMRNAEVLVDVALGLRNVVGMPAETVRKILKTANATFEQLGAPPRLLDEIGDTYQTLGDFDAALRANGDSPATRLQDDPWQRGNALVAPPAWETPERARFRLKLTASYDRIGDVLKAQGKLDEALKAYRKSLDIR